MENNKIVYIHRKNTDDTIFYVGIGNKSRAFANSKTSRSSHWHNVVDKHGYYVQILHDGLSMEQATNVEKDLIHLIGREDKGLGTLVNLSNGGECSCSLRERFEKRRFEDAFFAAKKRPNIFLK